MRPRAPSAKTLSLIAGASRSSATALSKPAYLRREAADLWRHRWLYVLLLPGLLYFLIYVYVPLLGNAVAFQAYSPYQGFTGSPWVRPQKFQRLVSDPDVSRVVANTIVLSLLQLVIAFPVPIILALMLNELRSRPLC